MLTSCLFCSDVPQIAGGNDEEEEAILPDLRSSRRCYSTSLTLNREETLRELLEPNTSLPLTLDSNESKLNLTPSKLPPSLSSRQIRRHSDVPLKPMQLNRISVDVFKDHPLSSMDNTSFTSNTKTKTTNGPIEVKSEEVDHVSLYQRIITKSSKWKTNIADKWSKNSNIFTEAFSSSLKDIVVRGDVSFNSSRYPQIQSHMSLYYSCAVTQADDDDESKNNYDHDNDHSYTFIDLNLNNKNNSMEVELKDFSFPFDVIVDEFEIDSDMEAMKILNFNPIQNNNLQRQGEMYYYYYQEVTHKDDDDRLSEYSSISSVSSSVPISLGLSSSHPSMTSISGSFREFENISQQNRSENFRIFQSNRHFDNNNNIALDYTSNTSNTHDSDTTSSNQVDSQALSISDVQYPADDIDVVNHMTINTTTRSPTPRRRFLLRRRLIPRILQNSRIPQAAIDSHLFQLYRIQPFAAVGFLRALVYTGMGSLFFQVHSLYYWPRLDFNNESIIDNSGIIFEQISWIWILSQLVLQFIQCPMRYLIHQNLLQASRSVDAEEANQTLRSIMSSRIWWCNQLCGIIMIIFASFGLILFSSIEYYMIGPSKEILSYHILSLCCLNLLAFIIRVLLTIGLFYVIQLNRSFNLPIEKIGLTVDQISKLKKTKFNLFLQEKKMYFENMNLMCSICISAFDENEIVVSLPCDTRHIFCSQCIEQWLIRNNSCPLCQRSIQF